MSASASRTPSSEAKDERCRLDLGDGLELWEVVVDDLREQDKNARAMSPNAFARLEQTIGRDGRLESLPFCALTDRGVEVVSGHHRVRAARSAGVKKLFVIVDVTGLSRSQITAKQLAHNSITGHDDPQLVRELYESIEDVDARLEAYIDPKSLDLDLESLSVGNVNVDFASRTVQIVFVSSELARFEKAAREVRERLNSDVEQLYVAELERLEQFQQMLGGVTDALQVKAYGAILGATADIVLDALGVEEDDDEKTDRVHLAQIVKQAYLPREASRTIERALDLLEQEGSITEANRWQGLEYLAAEYLAGAGIGGDDESVE